jgi:hypothetical protein
VTFGWTDEQTWQWTEFDLGLVLPLAQTPEPQTSSVQDAPLAPLGQNSALTPQKLAGPPSLSSIKSNLRRATVPPMRYLQGFVEVHPLYSVSLRQSIAARAEAERSVLTGDDHSCDAKV